MFANLCVEVSSADCGALLLGGFVVERGQDVVHLLDVSVGVPAVWEISRRNSHIAGGCVEVDVGDALVDACEACDAVHVPSVNKKCYAS